MSRWKPDAAGRLMEAAIVLFAEQGYDGTTVAEIADRAGLTKRTFFRYFTDKREVLFDGSAELERIWVEGVRDAAPDLAPMAAVDAGLDAVAEMFVDRHAFAGTRAGIVSSHPELQERELIKLQHLADAVTRTLLERGVGEHAASLAAWVGLGVFHTAFGRWVVQDDPAALRRLMDEALAEVRAVTAAG